MTHRDKKLIDSMGVHSYHGRGDETERAQFPNDHKPSMLTLDEYESIFKPMALEIAYGVVVDGKHHGLDEWMRNRPKTTRWQRIKRRWSSRLDHVKDAWAVLRGTKRAVNEDDYY